MTQKLVVSLFALAAGTLAWSQSPARELARLLEEKGVISQSDLSRVEQLDAEQSVRLLTSILQEKGLINVTEAARVQSGVGATPANARPAVQNKAAASVVQPAQQPQTAPAVGSVTTQSKFPLVIYGTLLWNSFYNTSASNNTDIPLYASPKAPGPVENFGMTARQTRLGLHYEGPAIGGARLSGEVEMDFFGGKAALANGINMDILRLRLAFGRLDWTNFSLETGQDWAIFAPLNPTSLAEYAIPALSGSGNLWIRTPQIRTEWRHDLGPGQRLLWQLAALDPNVGDYPVAFATLRQPKAGELGRGPAVESRVALSTSIGDRHAEVGVSGHWNPARNVGSIGTETVVRDFQSWGVALDYNLPLLKWFALSGEVFGGRALGVFTGDVGQSYLAPGTPGEHGIGTRGGWMQAQFNWTAKWQTNAAYGIEAPELRNLITGDRAKNQTYMVNFMYKFSPEVTFAWEWRRFLTNYLNQLAANNLGDQANMAVAYTF
jgi:hypothetical protein